MTFRSEKELVEQLRERLGYKFGQKALARELRISESLLCLLLQGKRNISRKVAKAMGYKPMAYYRKAK
jgi:hypothetical protein